MSFLAELNFEGFEIRVLGTVDDPWWVAQDVCKAINLDNVSLAINGRADRPESGLDGDEKGIAKINTPSGEQQMLIINESGLYSLILASRKPEAKKFTKWITKEVIPSIRKTGEYSINQIKPNTDTALIQLALTAITEKLERMETEQLETTCYLQGRLEEKEAALNEAEETLEEINITSQEHPGCAGVLLDNDDELLTTSEFTSIIGIEERLRKTIAKRATTFQRIGKGENPTLRRNGQLLLELRYLKEAARSVLGL